VGRAFGFVGNSRHDACHVPPKETPMADSPWNFDVPTQMRQFAEQSVEQAKKAVDGFLTAAQKTAAVLETQANSAQSGVKDVREKVMSLAEQNITNSFEFAQKLVRAKDIQEVIALQQEFLKSQVQAMQEQTKDLGAAAANATSAMAKKK
jgi:phasin